jgi:hypothetical protein
MRDLAAQLDRTVIRLDRFRSRCREAGLDAARIEEAAKAQSSSTTLSFWEALQGQADLAGLGLTV